MITFTGLHSVADRTVFTDKGPIVKRPLDLLTGTDLRIVGPNEVSVASGPFTSSHEGKLLAVSGSLGGRNDGTFLIVDVVSPQRVRLSECSFDVVDHAATVALVAGLVNEIKLRYNLHRTRTVDVDGSPEGVHGTPDGTHAVASPDANDLPSAITLANDIRTRLGLHVVMVSGDPPVHETADLANVPEAVVASQLASVILLVNDLLERYELHRQDRFVHQNQDLVDRVVRSAVVPVVGTYPGPLTGPLTWTVKDPRYGMVADDPFDVQASVGGTPVAVEAVFGLLGAVVLAARPDPGTTVLVDYDHMANPPARFLTLNSFEFNLNQAGNLGVSGFPSNRYRARSYLINPANTPDLKSPNQPLRRGWKYKGLERAYTAALNDPSTLLLNVPTNKVSYPVLFQKFSEITLRYDPVTLPQAASDPWVFEGDGTLSLAPGGTQLTVADSNVQTGVDSRPPFFTHAIDLVAPSLVSAAFRVRMSAEDAVFEPDGAFGGVAFGVSDGARAAVVGLLLTEATNLTSACVLVNSIKARFNAHLENLGSHNPDDTSSKILIVDASDLTSLVILANEIRTRYLDHASKGGGVGLVHAVADSTNLPSAAATGLASAISLVNDLRRILNSHEIQAGVHFVNDVVNSVELVRQIGLLRRGAFPELQESWQSAAADWTEYKTYRLSYTQEGRASLYISGDTEPSAQLDPDELPAPADLDVRVDLAQQAFFGSIGRESKSLSDWQFVRINIQPLDANLIEGNKQVVYDAAVVPELDPSAPWIPYGQGGAERILPGSILSLDSTASAAFQDVGELGLVSGAYRGFARFEPALSAQGTALSLEFSAAADWWTHGIDNRAAAVLVDDSDFTIQLAFLQFSPTPASVTGSVVEPFTVVDGDSLVLRVGAGPSVTVTFNMPPDIGGTAAGIAAKINSTFGFALASDVGGRLSLTSAQLGADANITVLSGSALDKVGLSPGVYYGRDSTPEPRVSWFGANVPDLDEPSWDKFGGSEAELLGRTLRITDVSVSDYVAYVMDDALVTNQAFNPQVDWKLDFRVNVLSFTPGPAEPASGPYQTLDFAGALVAVDEGPGGKNVELHLATSSSGAQYVNLMSYDSAGGQLVVTSQYAFAWNDGRPHSFNIFTSKGVDQILVLADGQLLSPSVGPAPTYSGLQPGVAGPSISFGSGSESLSGLDLRAGRSVVDWESVAVFRDSKIGDASAASRRYVGLYKGGDPSFLSSYYLHQVDWSLLHTYRLVRDPSSGVGLYMDGAAVPSISAPYDVLGLPPAGSSYLRQATAGTPSVAFGSFNPGEMARTRWDFLRYAVGRITLTDRIVPPHNVLNQGNAVASSEHLMTTKAHGHQGFRVYSGGTPLDDFMADPEVPASTVLGPGTAPVPMTQDLQSRGGLVKVGTPVDGIPAIDIVNQNGYIADLVDDVVNQVPSTPVPTVAAVTAQLVSLVNEIKADFNLHRTQAGVHFINDAVNVIVAADASDLATSIVLVNEERLRFNNHLTQAGVHVPNGSGAIVSPVATDLPSAVVLASEIRSSYNLHAVTGSFHLVPDPAAIAAPDASDVPSLATLAETLRRAFSAHGLSISYHLTSDTAHAGVELRVAGLGDGTVSGLGSVASTFPAAVGDVIRFLDGPNAGLQRTVSATYDGGFNVSPPYASDDISGSLLVRVVAGQPVLDLSSTMALVNGLRSGILGHLTAPGVHPTGDPNSYSVPGEAANLSQALLLANALKAGFDSHITGETVHQVADSANLIAAPAPADPLASSISTLNSIRSAYLSHVSAPRVHLADDVVNVVLTPEATDFASAAALANSIKDEFNEHIDGTIRETQQIHARNDTVNQVTAPAATDLASLAILAEDERIRYNAHRTQPGVHGTSLFIRLDAPSRVLYESTKFWTFDSGSEEADLSPFSDDETLHWPGPFGDTSDTIMSYAGSVLPEDDGVRKIVLLANSLKAEYNAHRTQPGVHVVNDAVNVVTAPDATDLASAIVLLLDIKARWNLHLSQPGVHLGPDLMDISVCPAPSGAVMAASLANEISFKYGRHRIDPSFHPSADNANIVTAEEANNPSEPGWVRRDDGPGSATVSLVTVGPVQAVRYGTSGLGLKTAYIRKSGLAGSPPGLELRVKIRVDAYSYSPDVDTGMAVGVALDDGVTVAIGFDALGNVPYVKLMDARSGQALFRAPFNWADGNFHVYKIVKDLALGGYCLVVEQ